MAKNKKKQSKQKTAHDHENCQVDECREVMQHFANILKPFEEFSPEKIRKKASLVGNTHDGGIQVMQIVEAAYEAYRMMHFRMNEEAEAEADMMKAQAEADAAAAQAEYEAAQMEADALAEAEYEARERALR